jgi:hypothetical protein
LDDKEKKEKFAHSSELVRKYDQLTSARSKSVLEAEAEEFEVSN